MTTVPPADAAKAGVAVAVDEDDDVENAVFHERHSVDPNAEQDFQATCIDHLLCCVRNRCLGLACVVFPCGLFLLVGWGSSGATRASFLVMSGVPLAVYIVLGLVLVCLVCCRQIRVDTENAQAAHRYLHTRANLKKIAVTAGRRGSEMTVAGRFALFLRAAKENDLTNFQWCIDNGQDVDEVDHLGRSALHWAAMIGTDEIVSILLRNGASIDLRDTLDGLAPLHYAAFYGHVKVTRQLVDAGADMTQQDNRKMNPLQLAEMASLKLVSVQPSHQMIIQFLRLAMKDTATPPLQHITGLTVTSLVERQKMALPQVT
ncbi:hypothetical protein P43SY_001907 [Pythium insidiosum]|uniref:Uncharacterized protein n=1 Tax=Pythium insidiosum TaxID=114742 RepID=A0AAD5LWV8_PYTIN|nr:hypothetical protein P43SY_001907 [Pythium insidiosum]